MGKSKLQERYQTQWIDSEALTFDISTREELQQIEKDEFGAIGLGINWDRWDKLVQDTKEKITNIPKIIERSLPKDKTFKEPTTKKKLTYVYQLDTLELLGTYESQVKAAKAYGLIHTQVGYCISIYNGVYLKGKLFFTNKPINTNQDEQTESTNMGVQE